jgi:hypothetical protein
MQLYPRSLLSKYVPLGIVRQHHFLWSNGGYPFLMATRRLVGRQLVDRLGYFSVRPSRPNMQNQFITIAYGLQASVSAGLCHLMMIPALGARVAAPSDSICCCSKWRGIFRRPLLNGRGVARSPQERSSVGIASWGWWRSWCTSYVYPLVGISDRHSKLAGRWEEETEAELMSEEGDESEPA